MMRHVLTPSVKASIAKPVKRKIPLWNKANLSKLEADCFSFQLNFLEEFGTKSPVNTMWASIKKSYLAVCQSTNLQGQHPRLTTNRGSIPI